MIKLVFATNNKHKFDEIHNKTSDFIELLTLKDIGFVGEIPETRETIEGNAQQKALYIYEKYGIDCFADDTGLEVEALNGAPGVYSARYAGEKATYADNVNKLLNALKGNNDRNACFKTCIALIENGITKMFNGEIKGTITLEPKGDNGFGYDPVFMPLNNSSTFAEMSLSQKNNISHRAIASKKLIDYLNIKYK